MHSVRVRFAVNVSTGKVRRNKHAQGWSTIASFRNAWQSACTEVRLDRL